MMLLSKAHFPTIPGVVHPRPDSGYFSNVPSSALILARVERLMVVRQIEKVPNP
jgi:hypothetical protein